MPPSADGAPAVPNRRACANANAATSSPRHCRPGGAPGRPRRQRPHQGAHLLLGGRLGLRRGRSWRRRRRGFRRHGSFTSGERGRGDPLVGHARVRHGQHPGLAADALERAGQAQLRLSGRTGLPGLSGRAGGDLLAARRLREGQETQDRQRRRHQRQRGDGKGSKGSKGGSAGRPTIMGPHMLRPRSGPRRRGDGVDPTFGRPHRVLTRSFSLA